MHARRLYAHRGASAERPENTMPAFERAIEVGVDAIETDVHLTRDGVLIVSHDENAQRMTGARLAFADLTLDDVRRRCQQLGVGVGCEAVLARACPEPVAVTDRDGPDTGIVEHLRDGRDLVGRVLVRDRVRAVAHRRVDEANRHAATGWFACSSATLTAALVMMSRLPAYAGR